MLKTARTILAVTIAAAGVPAASAGKASAIESPKSHAQGGTQEKTSVLRFRIERLVRETWSWQDQSLSPHSRPGLAGRHLADVVSLRKELKLWIKREDNARIHTQNPPHKFQLLCIQSGIRGGRWSPTLEYLGGGTFVGSGEGSWQANTGNGYYGGLQEDLDFQRTYAPQLLRTKGTADRWTPWQQIWTAERAIKTRGFGPWPKTARACGLLS